MPNEEKLKLVLSKDKNDIKKIRLAGVDKTLDQMTIGELVELRAAGKGGENEATEVNAVTDNVTYTSSNILNELGRVRAEEIMKRTVLEDKIVKKRFEPKK